MAHCGAGSCAGGQQRHHRRLHNGLSGARCRAGRHSLDQAPVTLCRQPANCVLYCNARIDFVDIDPATLNMSVAATGAESWEQRPHGPARNCPRSSFLSICAGQSCDMAGIHAAWRNATGFRVIEDASTRHRAGR